MCDASAGRRLIVSGIGRGNRRQPDPAGSDGIPPRSMEIGRWLTQWRQSQCPRQHRLGSWAHGRPERPPRGISPDQPVITYCRIGERAAHTWFVLTQLLGYPDVRIYDGSWTEWGSLVRAPIVKGESTA